MAILDEAENLQTLKKLTLSKLEIGPSGLVYLGKALESMHHMTNLDLSYNKINTKSFTEFLRLLM